MNKGREMRQPHLIATGRNLNPDNFFLILDCHAIAIGSNAIHALNILFCAHWILNVSYFPRLITFYNFLEVITKGKKPKSSVQALLAALETIV